MCETVRVGVYRVYDIYLCVCVCVCMNVCVCVVFGIFFAGTARFLAGRGGGGGGEKRVC